MDAANNILSGGLLFNDGIGLICAFLMSEFYGRRKDQQPILTLYWFFRILAIVFFVLTLSDLLRESGIDAGFFTDSLGRGLMFRVPLTFALIWSIHRSYGNSSPG